MNRIIRCLCACVSLAGMPLAAETISWFSDAGQTHLDGTDAPMTAGFQFELGVFAAGFVPTALNVNQWEAHWNAADIATYNSSSQRFAGNHVVSDNTAPFTEGAAAWVLGHRDSPAGTERILFRNANWLWPSPDPMNPLAREWNARDADIVVLGRVKASGSPFLMRSLTFQTYAQWKAVDLTGEALDGPNDDPDQDGSPNLLEFVLGTSPKTAGPPVAMPVELVDGFLQISIPRRIERPAVLTVEVSGDLLNWFSGPSHTLVAADDLSALVVRDLTALDDANPARFIRLRAVLP